MPKPNDSRLRPQIWCSLVALAACLALVAAAFLLNQQPRYKGKPLGHWLATFNEVPPETPHPEAEAAIRAIGQRAVPYLLANIWANETPVTSRARIWLNHIFKRNYRSRVELCGPSWRALSLLGPNASSALPEIVKHAEDGPFEGRAMVALAAMGTNSIPALTNLCASKKRSVRVNAAFILAKTKIQMKGIHSFLAGSPFSEQSMLAYNIDKGAYDLEPLLENTRDKSPFVRKASLEAIASVPELLKAAGPSLVQSLSDPDPHVASVARELLTPGNSPEPSSNNVPEKRSRISSNDLK